ncbi:MAG: hypothetical protein IJ301_02900 [Clostridia bacterium]|nr:hypothetical protein [Clostridia bacterium]
MTNQNSVSIKAFAKRAKRRMTSGYWDKIREERDQYIRNNADENEQKIKELYAKRLMREFYCDEESAQDNEFYNKVCKLLQNNSFTLNPIGQLIDHAEYDKLDIEARQNYIIKLTDKYNEMRERFEREKQTKLYSGI